MLTDAECRNAVCPPDKKQARFADSGGLYLQVAWQGQSAGFGNTASLAWKKGWRWAVTQPSI